MAGTLRLISAVFVLVLSISALQTLAQEDECGIDSANPCNNKAKALVLKFIAIISILLASMIGVCLPLVTSSIPVLDPSGNVFYVVKAFASGIILATGFMHVLPDSFDMLRSTCLDDNPWHEFPFSGFVAMLSAIVTMAIDSVATSLYTKDSGTGITPEASQNIETGTVNNHIHGHGHHHGSIKEVDGTKLTRYRVIAMVLEIGIIVHSVVIGLSVGATSNTCIIKGLIAALCFHQMFEGMGLGGSILQAQYKFFKKATMAFFFAVTTPFGIAVGIGLSNTYRENSPHALITVGLLNAASAGLLIYMALVDLLAADFMGQKLQRSIKLQMYCLVAVFLGAAGMSILAKWA